MAPLEGSISVWAWDLASRARVDLVQASVAGEAFVAFSLLGAIVSSGLCWGVVISVGLALALLSFPQAEVLLLSLWGCVSLT